MPRSIATRVRRLGAAMRCASRRVSAKMTASRLRHDGNREVGRNLYPKGVKISDAEMETLNIRRDKFATD